MSAPVGQNNERVASGLSRLASDQTGEKSLEDVRPIRDEIGKRVQALLDRLEVTARA